MPNCKIHLRKTVDFLTSRKRKYGQSYETGRFIEDKKNVLPDCHRLYATFSMVLIFVNSSGEFHEGISMLIRENYLCPLYIFQAYHVYNDSMNTILTLLTYISTCTNPITYCFMNEGFRDNVFAHYLCCSSVYEKHKRKKVSILLIILLKTIFIQSSFYND